MQMVFSSEIGRKSTYCNIKVTLACTPSIRHLEIRLPVSGLERGQACHPFASLRAGSERSEGSLRPGSQTLRCAQDDMPDLQISTYA